MNTEAYPLQWPEGWPRTKIPGESRYKVGYTQAVEELFRELRLLKASKIVLSSNVPLRQDGLPYADYARRRIDDPGVAVYFVRGGDQQMIACDSWDRVSDNIRAVGLTVVQG